VSELTILVLRKKALKERGLVAGITQVVESKWQEHAGAKRRAAPRSAACKWVERFEELALHVHAPRDTVDALRPFGFGLVRDTIRPMWSRSRENRRAAELSDCGISIIQAVNRWLCGHYAFSNLGVWRALAIDSSEPASFSAQDQQISAEELCGVPFLANQMIFLTGKDASSGQ
jgi:hypothetical protein